MTTITFGNWNEDRWLEVSSHAGYAEIGKDIVCAGVSITAQSLAATLCKTEGVLCNVKEEEGRMFIVCRPAKQVKRYVDALFDMARTAFEMLHEQYPSHVILKS